MNDWIAISEIGRNAALAVAAFVGAYLAWRQLSPATLQARSANTQAELARRTYVMELFNRAAGQLRDPKLEVRLAAIYVLRGVAKDFPDFADPVFELMQAYLRAGEIDYGAGPPRLWTSRRSKTSCAADWSSPVLKSQSPKIAPRLDIHGAFVRRIDLSGTSLRDANLSDADAANASFRGADFASALLRGTSLRGADLSDAKNLTFEQLTEAFIDERTILPAYIDRNRLLEIMAEHSK